MKTPNHKRGREFAPSPKVPSVVGVEHTSPLDVEKALSGSVMLLIGGTGFLGKVLVSLLLKRFDEVGHIYLMVRPKAGLNAQERFDQELWPSACFDPVREGRTEEEAYAYCREKITAVAGDVTRPRVGLPDETFAEMKKRGTDVLVNVAGVVSFTPPIDEGFRVNTEGVVNLIGLAKEFGTAKKPIPILHTSTCYVAGGRTGIIYEEDPRTHPFPYCDKISREDWDPARELKEGHEAADSIREMFDDAQMESKFVADAKAKLRKAQKPTTGEVLEREVKKERSRALDKALVDAGTERSQYWGWPNTYTYTKAVGEQLLAASGVPYTIVRPAIVESSVEFPSPGWNEGINTTAPLIYMAMHGLMQFPTTPGHVMDIVPCDHVCHGTVLALAALLDGTQAPVYQIGTSDSNPLAMTRVIELTGMVKRRYMRSKQRGNPLLNRTLARFEPVAVSPTRYEKLSSPAILRTSKRVRKALSRLNGTPLSQVSKSVQKNLRGLEKQSTISHAVMSAFMPFISQLEYTYRCDQTRSLYARCNERDQERLPYKPGEVNWREYWRDVHVPGLRKWVFPHLEARINKRPRAEERFSDLIALLDEVADREGSRTAVQRLVGEGEDATLDAVSYRDLRLRAQLCAQRLADVGIHPQTRVALIAENSPEWVIAFFGILLAGAEAVLLDPSTEPEELERRVRISKVEFALLGESVASVDTGALLDLAEFTETPRAGVVPKPPEVLVSPDDVAAFVFSSDDEGEARALSLSHRNLTAVLASVAPLFKLTKRDSGLSVLPLCNTFELTCGLLLPMLRGAQVTYTDDVTKEKLTDAFRVAGITAMIGVPQVWQDIESQIFDDLSDSGPVAEAAFKAGLFLNQTVGKALGVNLGRVLFRPVHDRLGGKVRFMISSGGEVPRQTAKTFRALGIELKQGYGLTEAAPLLMTADSKGRAKPVPGLEVEIRNSKDGVGEIYAKGDHVMFGVISENDAEKDAMGQDGWMRTGELGTRDHDGRITVVGRKHEVVTLASGVEVYPRTVEKELLSIKGVIDVAVVGVPDGSGGERLAALFQVEEDITESVFARRVRSRAQEALDEHQRPRLVEFQTEALPKTAAHKIIRPQVVAQIVAVEAQKERAQSLKSKARDEEIIDVKAPHERERLRAPRQKKSRAKEAPISVPKGVESVVKGVLGLGQRAFYDRGMRVKVSGKHHIPHNRQTIVASNHASHLDMGLIKTGLGAYGQNLVALAAKDYFFEGKWRRTYFESFTNLKPLDRTDNPRDAMREASQLINAGKTILLFPEGTRSVNGEMGSFRPAVTYLALKHGVDILPVLVEGTYRAMPRGAFVPKNRKLELRIGAPISAEMLQVHTEGMRMSEACQKAADLVEKAVKALANETRFDAEQEWLKMLGKEIQMDAAVQEEHPLQIIFRDLEARFEGESVANKTTYYFSLGQGPETKWSVRIEKSGCKIINGKFEERADCVMKTDVKMFTRIVKEHYIPQVSEFMDGTVKTNDPELLTTFVQAFNL